MDWLSGWKSSKTRKPSSVLGGDAPKNDERLGPVPPPPRTAHAPSVSVFKFGEIPSQRLLRFGEGWGGFFLEGEKGKARVAALLVLEGGGDRGASPGDVLVWTTAASTASSCPSGPPQSPLSLKEIFRASPRPDHHIRRDDLGGKPVSGITGLRALARLPDAGLAVLRLGPPPTARWVFRGVRAIAIFSGKFNLVDGEEAKLVRAGSLILVGDPSATLYLEAGNDAALAVALAAPDFVAALG